MKILYILCITLLLQTSFLIAEDIKGSEVSFSDKKDFIQDHLNISVSSQNNEIKSDLVHLLVSLDDALVSGNIQTVQAIALSIEQTAFKGIKIKKSDQRFISEIYDDILIYTNRFKHPEIPSKDNPDQSLKKLVKAIDAFIKELEKTRVYQTKDAALKPVKKKV